MSYGEATTIRAQHEETLTIRHIMQYLEDAYGTLGASYLEYITTHFVRWDSTQPARLNFVRLEEFWKVLQCNDRNKFMSLHNILNAYP